MSHKLLTSCHLCPQVRMLSWNISRPKQWQWNTEAHNLPMNSEQEQELSVCVCVCANGSEHVYCMSDGGKLGWPWGGQHAFFVLQPCFHSWSLRSRAAPGCTFKDVKIISTAKNLNTISYLHWFVQTSCCLLHPFKTFLKCFLPFSGFSFLDHLICVLPSGCRVCWMPFGSRLLTHEYCSFV